MQRRILAIIGDKYHSAEDLSDALDLLPKEDFAITKIVKSAEAPLSKLGDFQGLIIAKGGYDLEGRKDADWLGEGVEHLESFVEAGGGLLCLHSGLSGYDLNPRMVFLAKATFTHHPHGLIPVRYESTDPSFPATSAMFEGMDEQYFLRFVSEETKHFFLSSNAEHGRSPAGWAHAKGKGRVICLTPGHTREILTNPHFQALFVSSLRWSLGL